LSALPLTFEANVGQADARVDYLARTGAGTVFLTPTAAVFSMLKPEPGPAVAGRHSGLKSPDSGFALKKPDSGVAVFMHVVGANGAARPVGRDQQPGRLNYFIGNDPTRWHTDIPTYGRVEYANVYPGVSLAYYGDAGGLEYDFIVAAGADAHAIALQFEGASGVELDAQGGLVVHTAAGDLVQHAPAVYQDVSGTRREVPGAFRIGAPSASCPAARAASCLLPTVSFTVGSYDRSRPLVIDPLVLGYSTYLGGSKDDRAYDVAVDTGGSAYVTGYTNSTNFPTTPGAFQGTDPGIAPAYVVKLNATGSALVYGTYLGGSNGETGDGIAVDAAGQAYVTGETFSPNFPTTPGAFDQTYHGGGDGYVAKLSADGSALVYGTYLGGFGNPDSGSGVAVDAAGEAYVSGVTESKDFPTTPGAFQPTYGGASSDGFITKLNADGSALLYSTYLGGDGKDGTYSIRVDGAGNAYVTGSTTSAYNFPTTPGAFQTKFGGGQWDAFVVKLNPSGTGLVYGTYLGGSGADQAWSVAVDGGGNAYVTGDTQSDDFPTTPGAFQTATIPFAAFVVKLNSAGSALVYGTFLGSDDTSGFAIAVDAAGNAYVGGDTNSTKFPTTAGAFDTTYNGAYDVFFAELNATGTGLVYGTYLGGSNDETGWGIAVDGAGSAYVVGHTFSPNFPTTADALKRRNRNGVRDGFVTKFAEV
jgi:hypothetical protein